jgi:hypothetical protein
VEDAPLYCQRCQRVTIHYRADPPVGTDRWFCGPCALIDALVVMEATDERWRTNRP